METRTKDTADAHQRIYAYERVPGSLPVAAGDRTPELDIVLPEDADE